MIDDTSDTQVSEEVSTEEVASDQPEQTESQETTAPSQIDPIDWLEKAEIDPSVKESLKSGFLRQRDYTQKTQEIAEIRKRAESYQQWDPVINYLQQNPQLAKELFNQQHSQNEEPELPDDPREFLKLAKEQAKAEAVDELRRVMTEERDVQEAEKLDPRLSDDTEFKYMIAGLVSQDQQFVQGQISAKEATQKAINAHKAYEDRLRQSVIKDFNEKAKKKTMVMPSNNGSTLGTAPSGKARTMREAAALAEEQLSR
jgi:hypothetical protein